MFIDYSKAYNSVDRNYALDRLRGKLGRFEFEIIKQIMQRQNVSIMDWQVKTDRGLPQGSALSPSIFNYVMDGIFCKLKTRLHNIKCTAYADDTTIVGRVDLPILKEISAEAGLELNWRKCATFNQRLRGINKRRTTMYLGTIIRDDGTTKGVTKVKAKLRKMGKLIKTIGAKNPSKGYRLFRTVAGGVWNFYQQRMDIADQYYAAMKTALKILRGVNRGQTGRKPQR